MLSADPKQVYTVSSEHESVLFAASFAKQLTAHDIVTFTGELGSGKTFLCRQIIRNLCESNINVISPTFNMLQVYETSSFMIYHFDFYRLNNVEEVYEIGVEDALGSGLCLIEWPQIIYKILPCNAFHLHLEIVSETTRNIYCNFQLTQESRGLH